MPRSLLTLLLVFFLASPAWPQDVEGTGEAATSSDDAAQPELAVPEQADDAAETDDSDLDSQTYEDDDDDFVPSEEIPADEPIPFPSNI